MFVPFPLDCMQNNDKLLWLEKEKASASETETVDELGK